MDAFGFYRLPENGMLSIVHFLEANLIGICQELCPQNIPVVIFVDEADMKPQSIISYSPDCDFFVLCPEKVHREFQPLMDNIPWLFIELWETVFHEVRHFVQHQCLGAHEHRDVLLTERVLEEIALRDPCVAQQARDHIAVYAPVRDEDEVRWEQEVDAVIVSVVAIGILASCFDGHSFDFEKIRPALMCTMHKDISALLDVLSAAEY